MRSARFFSGQTTLRLLSCCVDTGCQLYVLIMRCRVTCQIGRSRILRWQNAIGNFSWPSAGSNEQWPHVFGLYSTRRDRRKKHPRQSVSAVLRGSRRVISVVDGQHNSLLEERIDCFCCRAWTRLASLLCPSGFGMLETYSIMTNCLFILNFQKSSLLAHFCQCS